MLKKVYEVGLFVHFVSNKLPLDSIILQNFARNAYLNWTFAKMSVSVTVNNCGLHTIFSYTDFSAKVHYGISKSFVEKSIAKWGFQINVIWSKNAF